MRAREVFGLGWVGLVHEGEGRDPRGGWMLCGTRSGESGSGCSTWGLSRNGKRKLRVGFFSPLAFVAGRAS